MNLITCEDGTIIICTFKSVDATCKLVFVNLTQEKVTIYYGHYFLTMCSNGSDVPHLRYDSIHQCVLNKQTIEKILQCINNCLGHVPRIVVYDINNKMDIQSIYPSIQIGKKCYNLKQYALKNDVHGYCSEDELILIQNVMNTLFTAVDSSNKFLKKLYDVSECATKCDMKNGDEYTCSICTMIFNKPMELTCGHIFCDGCLRSLLHYTCSLCHKPFTFFNINKNTAIENIINNITVNCTQCLNVHTIIEQCFERNPIVKCNRCFEKLPITHCRSHFVSCLMVRNIYGSLLVFNPNACWNIYYDDVQFNNTFILSLLSTIRSGVTC